MKFAQRYSLGLLLCVTALIAVGISHAITSWNLRSAKSEIAWLKNARNTFWPDPHSINIVSLDRPGAAFRPKNKSANWRWKMMSPESVSLRLRWDASSKTLEAPPAAGDTDSKCFLELPTGTSELDVSIKERNDGKLGLDCNLNGTVHEFEFDVDSTLFSQHGFAIQIAGVRQTEIGDPAMPLLLACVRGYASSSVPSEGIRIWIEPTPD